MLRLADQPREMADRLLGSLAFACERKMDAAPLVGRLTPPRIERKLPMGILAWLALGVVAGFLASSVVNKHRGGIILDLILGCVGAVVGGFIAYLAGIEGITGFNLYSVLIAFAGSVLALVGYHATIRRMA
jgi:uncharacterized membrane protein YeaQ/YmgE (transglycosylase-associated protein family)